MKVPCPDCKGKGELYLHIAGDVHIAKCTACDGWGSLYPVLTVKPQKPLKRDSEWHKHQNFGAINLDDFLGDE